jgi:hypothetical protein
LKTDLWESNEEDFVNNKYGSDEFVQNRKIIIFKKKTKKISSRPSSIISTSAEQTNLSTKDNLFLETRQKKALNTYNKSSFGQDLMNSNGTHAMQEIACMDLINKIGLKRKDICWEIGCGNPRLSFLLSASATNTVVATDLRKIFFLKIAIFLVTIYLYSKAENFKYFQMVCGIMQEKNKKDNWDVYEKLKGFESAKQWDVQMSKHCDDEKEDPPKSTNEVTARPKRKTTKRIKNNNNNNNSIKKMYDVDYLNFYNSNICNEKLSFEIYEYDWTSKQHKKIIHRNKLQHEMENIFRSPAITIGTIIMHSNTLNMHSDDLNEVESDSAESKVKGICLQTFLVA